VVRNSRRRNVEAPREVRTLTGPTLEFREERWHRTKSMTAPGSGKVKNSSPAKKKKRKKKKSGHNEVEGPLAAMAQKGETEIRESQMAKKKGRGKFLAGAPGRVKNPFHREKKSTRLEVKRNKSRRTARGILRPAQPSKKTQRGAQVTRPAKNPEGHRDTGKRAKRRFVEGHAAVGEKPPKAREKRTCHRR